MNATNHREETFVAAIASLSMIGPARLSLLLATWAPSEAWHRLSTGRALRHPSVAEALGARGEELTHMWRTEACQLDLEALEQRHRSLGLELVRRGHPDYPASFESDHDPPELLFAHGDLSCLHQRMVAVIGTRRCTRYGHDVARRLGMELSGAGVAVVSGLALGIDGAAHEGALEAPIPSAAAPIGVVGSGLDVVYPKRNRSLWDRVATRGLLLSESPLGAKPEAWRFPARNRLIAALSEVVVVVESSNSGGSLLTVDEAALRGVDVMAVPGAITSAASEGTNRLIADGARPVLGTDDIFEAIGLEPNPSLPHSSPGPPGARDDDEQLVLDVMGVQASTFSEIAQSVDLPFDQLALVVTRLEASGRIIRDGSYLEQTSRA